MERYTKNKVLGQLIRNLVVVIGLLTAGQGTLVAGELIFDADFGNQADWQNTERGQSVEYPSNSARARAKIIYRVILTPISQPRSGTQRAHTGPHPLPAPIP